MAFLLANSGRTERVQSTQQMGFDRPPPASRTGRPPPDLGEFALVRIQGLSTRPARANERLSSRAASSADPRSGHRRKNGLSRNAASSCAVTLSFRRPRADGAEGMLARLDMPSGRRPQAGQPVIAEQHAPGRPVDEKEIRHRCGDGVRGFSRRKMSSVPASHDNVWRCSRPRSSVGSMPDTRQTIMDFRAARMLLRLIRRPPHGDRAAPPCRRRPGRIPGFGVAYAPVRDGDDVAEHVIVRVIDSLVPAASTGSKSGLAPSAAPGVPRPP